MRNRRSNGFQKEIEGNRQTCYNRKKETGKEEFFDDENDARDFKGSFLWQH